MAQGFGGVTMRVGILRREPNFSFSMGVYADGIVKGLQIVRPDWEILEFAPAIDTKNDQPALLKGINKYCERYYNYPQRLKPIDVDLFHIIDHSEGYLVRWLNSFGKPTIVTCHDLINLVQPDTFKNRASFPALSMAAWKWAITGMESANQVITVSSHTAKDVIDNLRINKERITVVPNAVDGKFRRLSQEKIKAFRQQQGLSPDTFCLLNVGSNNLRKNVSTVLKVLLNLKNNGLPVHFWKVGTGFNREQNKFIETNNLTENITYQRIPDDPTLVQFYNSADVLVAPSLYEGFGMTILEAMACGTPVVTSNVTSLPEVAGDAAILAPPQDISAISAAVTKIWQDQDFRQSLKKKGLKRIQQFTWEKTAEQIASVYEKVSISN